MDDGGEMADRIKRATDASNEEAERLATERRVVVRAKALAMELIDEALKAAPGLAAKLLAAAGAAGEAEAARRLFGEGMSKARERGLVP